MNTRKNNYLAGDKIGEAFYLEELPIIKKQRRAIFKCRCGKQFHADISNVKKGSVKGCGCWRIKHGHTIGHRGHTVISPEYNAWQNMIDRCVNKTNKSYKDYGERGITVCDRWLTSFDNFILDVGHRLTPKHSLDRIIVNGHYEPGNVKWSTRLEQARNKRSNITITHKGETLCLSEWAEKIGISSQSLWHRINTLNWSIDLSIGTPKRILRQ